jgi:hypothetical protein
MGQKTERQSEVSAPNIVEVYRDYVPPHSVRPIIADLLKTVPPHYLVGLQTIILTNQAAQPRKKQRQKLWSRRHKIKLVQARGYYSGASRTSRASITLHIDNILKGASARDLKLPLVRYFSLGTVLYHEIGHHIHAEHNPIYEGKENVAEDWSDKLMQCFVQTHYWYLRPLMKAAVLFVKLVRLVNPRFMRELDGR